MGVELNPKVKRFQAIKAAAKQAAIQRKAQEAKRKEAISGILQTSPTLTEKQAAQVLAAHERINSFEVRTFGESKRVIKVFRV